MAMPPSMILVAYHTMYIVLYDFNKLTFLYIYMYIYLSYYYANKSVMTFISVNKISVCLSVCMSSLDKLRHHKIVVEFGRKRLPVHAVALYQLLKFSTSSSSPFNMFNSSIYFLTELLCRSLTSPPAI